MQFDWLRALRVTNGYGHINSLPFPGTLRPNLAKFPDFSQTLYTP